MIAENIHDSTQIIFKRGYTENGEVMYKVLLKEHERVQIPVIKTVSNKQALGIIFDLEDGQLLHDEDVYMIVRYATDFIFLIVNYEDERDFNNVIRKDILKNIERIKKLCPDAKLKTDFGTIMTSQPEEAAEALEALAGMREGKEGKEEGERRKGPLN